MGQNLQTFESRTGTPAFAAPETLGIAQSGDRLNDSCKNAVDIWSLGVITFLILTGKTLFKDPCCLGQYVAGSFKTTLAVLLANKVSGQGCNFIMSSMAPKPEDRLGARECLQYPWLSFLIEAAAPDTQKVLILIEKDKKILCHTLL